MSKQFNDQLLLDALASGNREEITRVIYLTRNKIRSLSQSALNLGLSSACMLGHGSLVEFLVERGAGLETRNARGDTPLLICARTGRVDMAGMLIQAGACVNACDTSGDTPLILSVKSPDAIELTRTLLSQKDIDVDHQNIEGNTALMEAVQSLNWDAAGGLMRAGAAVDGVAVYSSGAAWVCVYRVNSRGESVRDVANRMFLSQAMSRDIVNMERLLELKLCKFNKEDIEKWVFVMVEAIQSSIQQHGVTEVELKIISKLVEHGADVNYTHKDGATPLNLSISAGSYDLVDCLCKHGANVSHNSLKTAVCCNNSSLIPLLVKFGGSVNVENSSGTPVYCGSALNAALTEEYLDCARLLLSHGAYLDIKTAVVDAVKSRKSRTLKFLQEEYADDVRYVVCTCRPGLLHIAVGAEDLEIIDLLLDSGADVNRVHDLKTPLMCALPHHVIKHLIERGADVNKKVLTTALFNLLSLFDAFLVTHTDGLVKFEEIVRTLLEHGAKVDDVDPDGNTALMILAGKERTEGMMELFIDRKSNINAINLEGNSALHFSVINNLLPNLVVLISHGADCNMQNKKGHTPLMEAVLVENLEMVKLLVEHKADVNISDCLGNTALLHAADLYSNNVSLTNALLQAGAGVNHQNNKGISALMISVVNLNIDLFQLLLENDVNVDVETFDDVTPKTPLAYLLNKWRPCNESLQCVKELLNHDADAKWVRLDVIHRLIALSSESLIPKLIHAGVAPIDVPVKPEITGFTTNSMVSPLQLSLETGNASLSEYFIAIWFLTPSDIRVLSGREETLQHMQYTSTVCYSLLKQTSTQPLSLTILSFVAVSSAIGAGPNRAERVRSTQLPVPLQEKLLFHGDVAEAEDGDLEDSDLLIALTRDALQGSEEFFESDMDFYSIVAEGEDKNYSDINKKILMKLLERGSNGNSTDARGVTALMASPRQGDYDQMEMACQGGAVPTHACLVLAVKLNQPNLIPLLVHYGADVNLRGTDLRPVYSGSALDVALSAGYIDCAKVLLYYGPYLNIQSAVTSAVTQQQKQTLAFLLDQCYDAVSGLMYNHQQNLLHIAVQNGDMDTIDLLLDAGADINYIHHQKTPLMVASRIHVIKNLLLRGADVNIKTSAPPLVHALSQPYCELLNEHVSFKNDKVFLLYWEEIVSTLLQHGADINGVDAIGCTGLMKLVEKDGSKRIMKQLLYNGISINKTDRSGKTALHLAVKNKCFQNARFLLKYGADCEKRCNMGHTVLIESVVAGDLDWVQTLLDHGVDTEAVDVSGNTALCRAADTFEDNAHLVRLLIKAGAKVNHPNTSGLTPLMVAAQRLNVETVEVLLENAADVNEVAYSCDSVTTPISLLLNKWRPSYESYVLAKMLLDRGATAQWVRPDSVHRIIASSFESLIPPLISAGVAPYDAPINHYITGWPTAHTVSPFKLALTLNKTKLADYFMKIWYLTKDDVGLLSRNEAVLQRMKKFSPKGVAYLNEKSNEPLSLVILSFIEVSTAMGSGPTRREKVNKSKLPVLMQKKLLFRDEVIDLEDGDIEDEDILIALTSNAADGDSYFYENDVEFFQDVMSSDGSTETIDSD
ncbi:uncharacterized protein LOC131939048 [Physella acuta]|uniref:uncharacterized protein LOC131939048 n=1 Tax=Physella acuta TaxID=109671 RepID=UPI0027DDA337|nr:uncharacterized protein LOC131939048 [Physella acuta]